MSDLVKRLRIKAGMIEMGEKIAWGSDTELMREAADALEAAAPAVQGEPVAYVVFADNGNIRIWSEDPIQAEAMRLKYSGSQVLPLYTAPQPTPDVAGLVEALESLIKGYVGLLEAGMDRITILGGDCDPVPVMEQNDPWLRDARAALAAYRKGDQP